MTTASTYLDAVNGVEFDIGTLDDFSGNLDTALDAAIKILEAPGKIEDELRERSDAIDLPNALVSALGFLPFGIGTAITQLDNAANAVSNAIDAQADIMAALDLSWAPTRTTVQNLESYNATASALIGQLHAEFTVRQEEAVLLHESLGDQELYASSQLVARLDSYETIAQTWFDARDTLLTPLQASLASFNAAIDAAEAAVPDISSVTGALDSVTAAFATAKNIADDIEDALDFTINLPWPLPDINLLDALETIGDFAGWVVDIISDFVSDALALIGININSVFAAIEDELMDLISPIFDVLDDLVAAAAALAGDLVSAANGLQDQFSDILAHIEDAVDDGSLFANTIIGDEAPDLVDFADTLLGTAGEDGIYGLEGDDNLNGAAGDDFLFGGNGQDTLISGAGQDELYGGADTDTLLGLGGNNLLDGGSGEDVLVGRAGRDTLIGGQDDDQLVGGANADVFVFGLGSGVDRILDFKDNVDTLEISTALLDGQTTAQQVIDDYGRKLGTNTLLNFGDDRLVLVGFTDPDNLADDLILV